MAATDAIDDKIEGLFRERKEAARQEAAEKAGKLSEETTTKHGKTYTRFYGDSRVAFAQFMPPTRTYITGFNNMADRRGRR